VLRLIDSLQLTAVRSDVVTPVDWKAGGDLIVKPGTTVEGSSSVQLPSGRDYLRYVKL
jgi:alkyl hydroperoxide reductase subunit AhpC